jgi:hypothetical protein
MGLGLALPFSISGMWLYSFPIRGKWPFKLVTVHKCHNCGHSLTEQEVEYKRKKSLTNVDDEYTL